MSSLRDRIAAIESALQETQEIDIINRSPTPIRHSLDHRFDHTAPDVDAPPALTPPQEKANPFETVRKSKYCDSVAAAYGLGILAHEEFTEYVVYDASLTNLRVCPLDMSDPGHYYYVEHRFFLPHVPGVVLRQGSEKSGPSLGVAHIPIQGENTIGIGDHENHPNSMVWEKMGNTGFWTHMRYEFRHEMPSGERKLFNWIRTRNNIMDDQGDLVLVENGKEQVVLVEYLGKGLLKWKKRGRLRIREMPEFGEKWEIAVLLGWASVVELSRRRARYRRYSPTHLIGI